jgi:glycosyltransferase involved in cell wall biosynthesis
MQPRFVQPKLVWPRLVINGRFLTQPMAGVQRWAIQATKAIDALIDSGEYGALDGRIEILAPAAARDFPLRHIPVRRCGTGSGYFWEQVELPFYARGRLLINCCSVGPVIKRDQVVVVHDATVRARPANFAPRFRMAYNFLIPRLIRRSRGTVTVSEFSRREIEKWYHADVSRMRVSYVGADHILRIAPDNSIIDRLKLAGRKFFLGVGLSVNKNGATVAAALRKSGLTDTILVMTGQPYAWITAKEGLSAPEGVLPAGFVTDAELRALYEHALAMISPSHYEGFGLPPVEAMLCGCPTIVSNSSAMPEICGDGALQCGPDDIDELARLMRVVHDDPAGRAALSAAGRARAARYRWDSTARVLLGVCLAHLPQMTNETRSFNSNQRVVSDRVRSPESVG